MYRVIKFISAIKDYIVAVVCGVCLAILIIEIFHPIYICGNSMNPTFKDGQIVIGRTIESYKDIARGDVVTYKVHGIKVIKRVVALKGDSLRICDGRLIVNNKIADNYPFIEESGLLFDNYFLGDEELFCIGDNINNSYDCRFTGPIKFKQVCYSVRED